MPWWPRSYRVHGRFRRRSGERARQAIGYGLLWLRASGRDERPYPILHRHRRCLESAAKMRSRGEELSLHNENMVEDAPGTAAWTARFRKADEFATAATPSLAICRPRSCHKEQETLFEQSCSRVFFTAIERNWQKAWGPLPPSSWKTRLRSRRAREAFPRRRRNLSYSHKREIEDSAERDPFVRR